MRSPDEAHAGARPAILEPQIPECRKLCDRRSLSTLEVHLMEVVLICILGLSGFRCFDAGIFSRGRLPEFKFPVPYGPHATFGPQLSFPDLPAGPIHKSKDPKPAKPRTRSLPFCICGGPGILGQSMSGRAPEVAALCAAFFWASGGGTRSGHSLSPRSA